MQKVKRFLLSRKTVIYLICAVGISCLAGSTIPQITTKSPQFFEQWEAGSPSLYYVIDLLQLNQVYTSTWFLILIALVALSLAYSVYYQSKTLIKLKETAQREITERSFKDFLVIRGQGSGIRGQGSGIRGQGSGIRGQGSGIRGQGSEVRVEELARKIKRVFKVRGYRLYPAIEKSRYFLFGKNRAGRWGGVIFHLGLLLCILAALYGLAFQKRGFVQLKQADTFQGKNEDWQAKSLGVFAGNFDPGFKVYLNKFTPSYWENDQIKNLESSLTIIDSKGEAREFLLSPAGPIRFKGTKVYQAMDYGYAIGFILKKEGREDILTDFLLDVSRKKDKPLEGKMDFPTTDYILNMKFYPNLIEPSFYATFPGVDLTVMEKGEQRFKGRVLFSQRAGLNNKDSLSFIRICYWTGLTFVKNCGMPLVYCGFALSTLGAFLIFMLPYKQVYLKVTEDGNNIQVSMGGRSNRYNALFSEEFKELGENLEKELGKHGNDSVT
ncbi:MAG TPA: cytochrome c biogenesis protein ResB [Anaerolineae bacterium]|nr:cytochrome c biogenesis protein ResB [Anaerolineae bacterium]